MAESARRIFLKWTMLGMAGLLARGFPRAVVGLLGPTGQSAAKEHGKENAVAQIVFRKRLPSAYWKMMNSGNNEEGSVCLNASGE